VADELKQSPVFVTSGNKASAPLTFTTELSNLSACDYMLVLLDERTWTSGDDTAELVKHVHEAIRAGVNIVCVHEFLAVVGPERHACDFGRMFDDDWTPAHCASGETNLYKEIAIALKGSEWRQPGLVAFATKLATSAGTREPIRFEVPASYEPKKGPNVWAVAGGGEGDGGEGDGGEGGGGGEGAVPPVAAPLEAAAIGEGGNAATSSSEVRASAGASALMRAPAPNAAPPPRPQTEVELASTSTAVPTSASQGSVRASAVVGRARGNSLAEDSSVGWLAVRSSGQGDDRAGQPAATAHAPAAEPPADPATQSPMAALPEPIAALTKRFSRMLSSDQTGEGEQGGSSGNLGA